MTGWEIIASKNPRTNTQYNTWRRVRAQLILCIIIIILRDRQRIL